MRNVKEIYKSYTHPYTGKLLAAAGINSRQKDTNRE